MLLASRSRCRSGCTRAMISQRERRQLEQQVEKEETDGRLGKGKGVCGAQEKGKGVCWAQEAQTCSKDGYERMHTNSRELLQRFQNETANWCQRKEETHGQHNCTNACRREGGSQRACAYEDCGDCVRLHPESNVDAEKEGLLDGKIGEDVEHDHVEHVPVGA